MKPSILITDSLFIHEEHIKQLEAAGFELERLDKPKATEEELIQAIKGKTGYILGGIEQVTDKVIDAADQLRAIVFTGADYRAFIPGYEAATKKGIAIANAPGANTFAVAEYTVLLILIMLRHVVELGNTGELTFKTGNSINEVQIGIVGLGRIGRQVAKLAKGLGADRLVYWSRHRKADVEQSLGLKYMSLEELMATSDVITNHLSSSAGQLIGKDLLNSVKDKAIIINSGFHDSFDMECLYNLLESGRVRAGFDQAVSDPRFSKLPLSVWFSSKENAGYNTFSANKLGSDMATGSIISLLKTGEDQFLVNPEHRVSQPNES